MPTEFDLLELSKLSAWIYILGSIVLIEQINSAESHLSTQQVQSEPTTSTSSEDENSNSSTITPTKLALLVTAIYAVGNFVGLYISNERLKQKQIAVAEGRDTHSLTPNYNFLIGATLSAVGSVFSITGAIQKVQEEAPLTII